MSIFKRPLVAMLVIIACSSVSTAFAETTDATPSEHESHHTESQRDWSGLYQGFLPCVDCKGIKTMLALNPNNSYILITQHVGKSDREITEKGKFAWDEATNTIILTPRNSTETHSYLWRIMRWYTSIAKANVLQANWRNIMCYTKPL